MAADDIFCMPRQLTTQASVYAVLTVVNNFWAYLPCSLGL